MAILDKAFKKKITGAVGTAIASPAIAYHGIKGEIANQKYKNIVSQRNFKNRKDDTNKYKGRGYWLENKN